MKTETVSLNLGDVQIRFLAPNGRPLRRGQEAQGHLFNISGPGIDPDRVVRVKLPTLDYGKPGPLVVKVEMRARA